jgi:apolipoprotein N-acyltransferase
LVWCASVLILHGIGWRLLVGEPLSGAPATRLLLLQPAIPTRHKFEFGQQQRLLERLAAAEQEGVDRAVEAVLLPEGPWDWARPSPFRRPWKCSVAASA